MRSELADKDVYVVAKTLQDSDYSGNYSVKFVSIKEDIPAVIPDNSLIATISISSLVFSVAVIIAVKTFETVEHNAQMKRKILQ